MDATMQGSAIVAASSFRGRMCWGLLVMTDFRRVSNCLLVLPFFSDPGFEGPSLLSAVTL